MRQGRVWERRELILALELYFNANCSPDKDDPQVNELAVVTGRTPGAVALKLANFRAIDPDKTGGMPHHGGRDKEVWNEFRGRPNELRDAVDLVMNKVLGEGFGAETAARKIVVDAIIAGDYFVPDSMAPRKVRRRQDVFRDMILESYGNQCALCDVDLPDLLTASHILPWSEDAQNRLNPENGIAMCALHDRAFDRLLIAIGGNNRVTVAPFLVARFARVSKTLRGNGKLRLPQRHLPNPAFLRRHRQRAEGKWTGRS